MRSKPILLSIFISAIILIITAFAAKSAENKYNLPFDIAYHTLSKPIQKQIDCLAENIYFEAANEAKEGKVAVAMVTMNRLASGNYAEDICGVVKQKTKNNGLTVCQFSWVCEPKTAAKRLTIIHTSLYNEIRDIAVHVMMNYDNMHDVTKGATYYHADYVNPGWGLPKTTKIGRHIFYKSKRDLETMNKEIKL
jgi:spore germination cell wall hydrolase CwlJ-like protein